ncbi:MAG: hypothetical protein KHZ77_03835 [Veillonella sp.]|uniref:hypothetical protein n=1 Tax=Veillonella sp. TaxID=1926307 RepID=UPI0026014E51|nr:hypothetical protein [Veillonella sp.]MBS4913280.1 hypothetical protein [Veillonella sp.]
MHSRQGIISKAVIESVRRALHNKYVEDSQIKCMLEEFLAEDLTPQELEITGHAYKEVKDRLAYSAVLDGLWQEIEETQTLYDKLHVYDSLEKEYSSAKTRLDHEDLPINSIDLEEVDMGEEGDVEGFEKSETEVPSYDKSLVTREIGAIITRGNQTLAERHDGAIVTRHQGSVAIRPLQNLDVVRNMPLYGTDLSVHNKKDHAVDEEMTDVFEGEDVVNAELNAEPKASKKGKRKSKCKGDGKKGGHKAEGRKGEGRKSKKDKHKRYEKVEPLDFDALEEVAGAVQSDYNNNEVEFEYTHTQDAADAADDTLAVGAASAEVANETGKDGAHEKGKVKNKAKVSSKEKAKKRKTKQQIAQEVESKDGELYLKDILTLLDKDGSEAGSLEDIIRNTEWKEFKQLTKRAKKALKRARKAAKEMAVTDFVEHYGNFDADMRDPEEPGAVNNLGKEKMPAQEPQKEETVETRETHEEHETFEAPETHEAHTDVSVEKPKKEKKESLKAHKKHTKSKK